MRAEREQGITIDVAYRYFSTSKRKFIIADTPGHEQYTRNMATGASTADVAIILIDANAFVKSGGLLPQSKRHTFIASLLRIPHIVAAVNKMDLVDFSEEVFGDVRTEFLALTQRLGVRNVELVPVSALLGDNIVEPSTAMQWYTGTTLLEYLETVPLHLGEAGSEPLRFPVQLVSRPDATFRGFSGRIERGELRAGQTVRALPSGRTTRVSSILTYDGELKSARSPQSVTVTLDDEIDISRGEMLVAADEQLPFQTTALTAKLVWMVEQPLREGETYLLKHTTRAVRGTVRRIHHRVDVLSGQDRAAAALEMNDIAEVELHTNLPLFFDTYGDSRPLGSFILIDPVTNATVAAGMISAAVDARSGQPDITPAFIWTPGNSMLIDETVRALRSGNRAAVNIDDECIPDSSLPAVARALQLANVVALSARLNLGADIVGALKEIASTGWIEGEEDLRAWLKEQR